MLTQRIITALIGIPIAVYIINYGQWLYSLTIAFLTCMAWREYCTMMKHKQINIASRLGLLGVVLLVGCAWQGSSNEIIFSIMLVLIVILAKVVSSHKTYSLTDASFTLMGILYVGLCFSHLLLLRATEASIIINTSIGEFSAGAAYLWLAFIGTWASDTFAYFVGTYFGKHKLCPAISPGKTYEGAIGGLIGCIIFVILVGILFKMPIIHTFLIGLLVGIVAPGGDLVESAMKRFAGVKDSGGFFPGHGGVLDRFDSILFAVPVVYYYINIVWLR